MAALGVPPIRELERSTLSWVEGHYPQSMVHVTEIYLKGLAYANVGRVDEAKRMLQERVPPSRPFTGRT